MRTQNDRLNSLIQAFHSDGYEVVQTVSNQGKIGLAAAHRTACSNGDVNKWRYDTLNAHILEAIEEAEKEGNKGIGYDTAKDILDFLNPAGRHPEYYGREKQVIEGSLSLFDLKKKTVETHYGYYKDEWIKLTLLNYIF